MEQIKKRIFHIDDDSLEIEFYYDPECQMYFGEYPVFKYEPRYTPEGRPWVNVCETECPYADKDYDDCGSCQYLKKELASDLIGVCQNDACMKKEYKTEV